MDTVMTSYLMGLSSFCAVARRSYTPPLCTVAGKAMSSKSCFSFTPTSLGSVMACSMSSPILVCLTFFARSTMAAARTDKLSTTPLVT